MKTIVIGVIGADVHAVGNKIIEFVPDYECPQAGYLLSGHCGIAAYMILAARFVLQKKRYSVSQFVAAE